MSTYSIHPEARRDLQGLYRYIAAENQTAALRLIDRFYEKFDLLSTQPLMGEAYPHLSPSLRVFTIGNYVILYEPTDDGVYIVQIVHSAQDIATAFRRD